jgi:hypothetical protein
MTASPFGNGKRAIDLLKAESNMSEPVRHVMKFPSGAELPIFTTPVTLAQRKMAARNAGDPDDQLAINLQLLVLKAKDENGQPLFTAGELPELRNAVDAGLVAELIGKIYEGKPTDDEEEDVASPKPSSRHSAKMEA